MQAFMVNRSLETQMLEAEKLEDLLDPKIVLIITDDEARSIYIFQGSKTSFVDYLIAGRVAMEIKKYMRGFYQIIKLKDENNLNQIRNHPISKDGKIPEIYNPNLHCEEENQDPIIVQNKLIISSNDNWTNELDLEDIAVFKPSNISKIQEEIDLLPEIPGYKTEMIQIGTAFYNKIPEIVSFFDENRLCKKIKTKYRKLGNLPEGFFQKNGYSTRLIIKEGRLQALQYLKPEDQYDSSNSLTDYENEKKKGVILAPVLFQREIISSHKFIILENAFNVKEAPSIEELIDRVKSFQEKLD